MKNIAVLCSIDDEEAIAKAMRILEKSGYNVIYFNRISDAQAIDKDNFDLLIMYGTGTWWVREVTPLLNDLPKMLYIYTVRMPDLKCETMRGAVRPSVLLRTVGNLI